MTTLPVSGPTVPAASQGADNGGALHAPHRVSGHGEFFDRTVRVPLTLLSDAEWMAVRRLAYLCASYGNHQLSAAYVKAKTGGEIPAYTDAKGELSAAIRDAVGRECVGLWRRLGKRILRGEQTLARYSAARALVIRDRGVHLERAGDDLVIALRLAPGREEQTRTRLRVWMPALRKDRWLRDLLTRLWNEEWAVTKATVQFERPGRKVFVRLSYRKPADTTLAGGGAALLTLATGDCWLRANGHALSLNAELHRLREMKTHYAGIHARLRRHLGTRGRRQTHRRALLQAGTFEAWAEGPLHQLSRQIVTWCQRESVGAVAWSTDEDSTLPWARLIGLVTYKAEEVGMRVSQIAAETAPADELRSEAGADAPEPREKPRGRKRSQRAGRTGTE